MQVQGIVVEMKFVKSKIPRIAGKPSELRELFVNLINNALDAMPQGGGIALETGTREGNVYALVTDNGQGISPDILDKIFDPFFTTREPTNSGLGLSIVLGIVERHCGTIGVRSELREFTEFRVELPSMLDDFRATVRPDAERVERVEPAPTSAKARILIIDDEADIRSLLADMLASEGHEVDVASSGEEGIRKCKRGKYDHVITDLGMPHMSGWEVARRVKEIRPEAAVILATGWGMHFDEEQLKSAGISRVITKPFQVEEVLTCINGRP
jgi:CheY-like chemotaxis protein